MSKEPKPKISAADVDAWRNDFCAFGNACVLIVDGIATHYSLEQFAADAKHSGYPKSGKLLMSHPSKHR